MKNIPSGFGFYLRKLQTTKDIQGLISRCQQAKASWVSIMVEASDGFVADRQVSKAYATALQTAGIDVYVWTFPGGKRATVAESGYAAELAVSYCMDFQAKGVMLDVEVAYKGQPQALRSLVTSATGLLSGSDKSVAFVSYPIPSFHKDIDWELARMCDWGSPMLYDTSGTAELIQKSYTQWTKYNPVWIPSLATYDTNSPGVDVDQLKGDLDRVRKHPWPAAIFWSESSTGDDERKLIASFRK